tara:strand:- start:1768 stop:1905 length:138 start_codon:yes stop_codon:yes gene_type:complete
VGHLLHAIEVLDDDPATLSLVLLSLVLDNDRKKRQTESRHGVNTT